MKRERPLLVDLLQQIVASRPDGVTRRQIEIELIKMGRTHSMGSVAVTLSGLREMGKIDRVAGLWCPAKRLKREAA